jgi:hypothetical protein
MLTLAACPAYSLIINIVPIYDSLTDSQRLFVLFLEYARVAQNRKAHYLDGVLSYY